MNGIYVGNIMKWEKSTGKYKGINNVSMSDKFLVILFAACVLKQEFKTTGNQVWLLPEELQDPVATVYTWPYRIAEGCKVLDINEEEQRM